jgi:hypothetical protein
MRWQSDGARHVLALFKFENHSTSFDHFPRNLTCASFLQNFASALYSPVKFEDELNGAIRFHHHRKSQR